MLFPLKRTPAIYAFNVALYKRPTQVITLIVATVVLSQHGYFKDSSFINYLDYLQYWKEQKYAKFLR